MKKKVYIASKDFALSIRDSHPKDLEEVFVYKCLRCSNGWMIRGYEEGGGQCFHSDCLKDPKNDGCNSLSKGLAAKQRWEDENSKEVDVPERVFKMNAHF
jgi:hypothetical protein